MDQPEGGRKEQMKAESVKAFGADAGPTAAGRAHPIRIAARASADAGMGVSENRTDGMRRDVARTGAVWPNRACYSPDSFRRFLEGRLRQLRHFWGTSFRLEGGTAD